MTRAPAPAPRTLRPVAWIMDTLAAIPRALPELHGKDEGAKGAELGYRQFGAARVLPSSIVQNPGLPVQNTCSAKFLSFRLRARPNPATV